MERNSNKLRVTGDMSPKPCDAYKNGFCMEMQRPCDMCYENSIKIFSENKSEFRGRTDG